MPRALTDVADKTGALHTYMLVSDDADLSKHVGHRVENTGKRESHAKSETSGDLSGLPFLGVKSVRTIAAVCP